MQASQLAYDYITSIFSNIGRNGVEYYWWGYRVYVDGPTCELLTTWGPIPAGLLITIPEAGPFVYVFAEAFIIEVGIYNNGKGVYYDVYWPVFPLITACSPYYTMESQ